MKIIFLFVGYITSSPFCNNAGRLVWNYTIHRVKWLLVTKYRFGAACEDKKLDIDESKYLARKNMMDQVMAISEKMASPRLERIKYVQDSAHSKLHKPVTIGSDYFYASWLNKIKNIIF